MKRKYLAIILGLMMGVSLLAGCGTGQSADSSTEEETTSKVYGEITALSDSGFTLDSGMGDTMEITVTDDTEITSQASGGMGGMQGGGDMSFGDMDESGDADGGGSGDGDAGGSPEEGDSSEGSDAENGRSGEDGSSEGNDAESGSSDEDDAEATRADNGDFVRADFLSESTGDDTEEQSADENDSNDAAGQPSGDMPDSDGGTPPDMPSDSDGEGGDTPDMISEDGESDFGRNTDTTMEFEDLAVGDVVAVTCDGNGEAVTIVVLYTETSADTASLDGGTASSSGSGVSYTAVYEYTSDTTVDGETITSTGTDENAILVSEGASVTITDSTVTRTSDDSTGGDDSSFYGVGAAVLTTDGTTYVSETTVETDAAGGAGIFAYGDSVVYAADCTITTQQDTSGGIHAAGGGTLYAWNLAVETNGNSAAAIRSDRGGGTMVVDEGTYTSNGTGSPAVYCTADIAVHDAQLTATASEAVCIEGLNTLRLYDCDLSGSMADDSQNDCTWNIILYQSMSGDSEVGNSVFEMVGGTLTAENGGMFYTTNTESTFTLSGVDITYADDNDFFLRCTGNDNERGWGSSGSNGADCLFTAIDQEMEGDIIWDSISQLDFYMTDGSTLTGAVLNDETYAGNGGDGTCNLYIGSGCTWVVTGDSVLSSLQNAGTITDASGNTVTIQGSDGTVYVEGTSSYKITVDSYETDADLSGASSVSEWSDYEVEKPDAL